MAASGPPDPTQQPATVQTAPISPAVLIEIDHHAVSSPAAMEHLGEIAADFVDALTQSSLDPATPEYQQLWNRERAAADARFRAMYGGHAWMAHHVQSHHLQMSRQEP
jgi:hypothetical protein